ncbi:MAG: BMP family ABC transporter substrate-binding protein [Sulfolobales archaeon]
MVSKVFLGIYTIVLIVVGLLIGFFLYPIITPSIPATAPKATVTIASPSVAQITTVTMTSPATITLPATAEELRVLFVYVGPIGDLGWTHAHDMGRRYVESLLPWVKTRYMESVDPARAYDEISTQIRTFKPQIVFTTSYDFMEATVRLAKTYRDVIFFHCSGDQRDINLGTYFADLYQAYYINGLMAGALTKTGKIGYVAAKLIPEVIRHINAFTIGAQEVGSQLGKNITVYVIETGEWYNPDKARAAASALVTQYGVDVLAFTEDSSAVVEFAESLYKQGKTVYVFGHYSPMYKYGPDVVVSGQLVNWGPIYLDIIMKVRAGVYNTTNLKNVDYWWLLAQGAVEVGADFGVFVNPKFVDTLKSIFVIDKVDGKNKSVYDLAVERYNAMRESNVGFDPFTGPLYDINGRLRVPEGVRMRYHDIWYIDWYVKGVAVLGRV